MAEKKFFVDVNLQGNNINNLKADTLDITANLASANTKRIVYHNGSYYYSDGTTWNILATALGYTPENEANKSTSTSLGTSDALYPTQNAVKVYADNLLGNANALVYKGTIDCSTNPNYPAGDAGWMYIASIAGKIGGASGTDVEVGDMIICNTDGTVSGNQATVGQYWNVIQKNIVGAVTGPASSVSNNVVFFDGTTGKIIKDSGLTLSGSNTGDETTATIKTKLGIATTSVDGYLTSTNWTTFNNKIGGSGTTNYISKFTASGTIGNSLIQDNGTGLSIGISSPYPGVKFYVAGTGIGIVGSGTTYGVQGKGGQYGVWGESTSDTAGTYVGVYGSAGDIEGGSATYIGGRFVGGSANGTNYSLWLQDNTEGVGKFLKSITSDGKANWATLTVADTGLTLTTTGTNGAATLVGNTLNIPTYESSLIPKLQGNEIWRGNTYRNNSTTVDTTSGLTVTATGTPIARAVATTSYATRGIRLGITASITATGRYSGVRGSALLWYVTGGFLYTGEFNISDTATAVGTHNFWGLASSTSDLVIGDVGNSQPSALTNIIAFANDSGDTNLQIMYNDASGTATKTDLGSSFPANRTAGAAITTIYSCYLYNAPASSNVIYRIVNKETGAVAQGTLSTNLPASTVGLNFFGARTMGTSGGGINNSGQFDVYRLGVYSL